MEPHLNPQHLDFYLDLCSRALSAPTPCCVVLLVIEAYAQKFSTERTHRGDDKIKKIAQLHPHKIPHPHKYINMSEFCHQDSNIILWELKHVEKCPISHSVRKTEKRLGSTPLSRSAPTFYGLFSDPYRILSLAVIHSAFLYNVAKWQTSKPNITALAKVW